MLELEVGRAKEKVGVKQGGPCLLYKGNGYQTPPPEPENLPIPKESYQWNGWVIHARIDENPAIRGDDLCFDKTCLLKLRLETWNGRRKIVRNDDQADVMSRYKSCQQIGLVKYYALCGCVWNLFCRAGHDSCVRNLL